MLMITYSQQICAEIVEAACSTLLADDCIFEEIKEIILNVDSKCCYDLRPPIFATGKRLLQFSNVKHILNKSKQKETNPNQQYKFI